MKRGWLALLVCLAPVIALGEESLTLVDAYQRAVQHDATLRAAVANNLAQQQEIDMAFAPFLPQARISAYKGKATTDRELANLPGTQHFNYDSNNYSLSVRQSLFNKATFAGYNQAKSIVAKSDAILQKERINLMSRVAGSYLNLLLNTENLRYSEAQIKSIEAQLEQAKRRYKSGFGTVTEVSEAEANLQSALAKKLEYTDGVEYAKRELENVTGLYVTSYFMLDPDKLPMAKPEPDGVDEWIALANSKNPEIIAATNEIEAARQEIAKNNSGHFPTLDLVAARVHSENDAANTIGAKFDTSSIGVQLNIPIYSGGYVNASVRQAVAKHQEAQEKLTERQRAVSSEVRKYFNDIVNGISRIQALQSSVKSYEVALTGTQKGFAAGVRSNVEVLNAQEKLFASIRDLAKERYTLVFSKLQLKQAAGTLSEVDVREVSGWMSFLP